MGRYFNRDRDASRDPPYWLRGCADLVRAVSRVFTRERCHEPPFGAGDSSHVELNLVTLLLAPVLNTKISARIHPALPRLARPPETHHYNESNGKNGESHSCKVNSHKHPPPFLEFQIALNKLYTIIILCQVLRSPPKNLPENGKGRED